MGSWRCRKMRTSRRTRASAAWRSSGEAARAGLESLLSHGDVDGVVAAELARLQSPRKLPAGWHNFFMLGGGPVIFNDIGNGAISCEPLKNAGILQRPVGIELKPQTKLSWRLVVDRLLTFRGDTDEAWRRAESFIVDDLRSALAPK
jgi:hypothetical protein